MKTKGYITVDRGIFDHILFRNQPLRLIAWQWMIATASWRPEGKRGAFGVVDLDRGQLVVTLRNLSEIWHWPKSNVDCFLKRLEREGMITVKKTRTATRTATRTSLAHPVSIITICNYDKFQNSSTGRKRSTGHDLGHQPGQGIQQTLPLLGLITSEPLNQPTKDKNKKEGSKIDLVGSGQARQRVKPRHGATGKGMIWCDHDTDDWRNYATDFEGVTGTTRLPEQRVGGAGNWFKITGEASLPAPKRGVR